MKDRFNFGLPFLLAAGQVFFSPGQRQLQDSAVWMPTAKEPHQAALWVHTCMWTGKKQYHTMEKKKWTQPQLHLNWPLQKREDFQNELVSKRTWRPIRRALSLWCTLTCPWQSALPCRTEDTEPSTSFSYIRHWVVWLADQMRRGHQINLSRSIW